MSEYYLYQDFLVNVIATGYGVACIFNNDIGYMIVLITDLKAVN
jgi:hypothetical protein